jgi:magnesium chelatase family protein
MAYTVHTFAVQGIVPVPVTVESDLIRRLPAHVIVGLSGAACPETSERVRSAIAALGLDFPRMRIVTGVFPAELKKLGTHYDLAIAVSILLASEQLHVSQDVLDEFTFYGGLTREDRIRGERFSACMAHPNRVFVGPRDACAQVVYQGGRAHAVETLSDVVALLRGNVPIQDVPEPAPLSSPPLDFRDVALPSEVFEQLTDAAVTKRPLLLVAPNGCNTTMIATRLSELLPPLTENGQRIIARIANAAGLSHTGRPFRAPHHSISEQGLRGSRAFPVGELALAHKGVILFDQWPEFRRACKETIKHAYEARNTGSSNVECRIPANFWPVFASTPCPCGHVTCKCSPEARELWEKRMTACLPERTLRIDLSPVAPDELLQGSPRWTTSALRSIVRAKGG